MLALAAASLLSVVAAQNNGLLFQAVPLASGELAEFDFEVFSDADSVQWARVESIDANATLLASSIGGVAAKWSGEVVPFSSSSTLLAQVTVPRDSYFTWKLQARGDYALSSKDACFDQSIDFTCGNFTCTHLGATPDTISFDCTLDTSPITETRYDTDVRLFVNETASSAQRSALVVELANSWLTHGLDPLPQPVFKDNTLTALAQVTRFHSLANVYSLWYQRVWPPRDAPQLACELSGQLQSELRLASTDTVLKDSNSLKEYSEWSFELPAITVDEAWAEAHAAVQNPELAWSRDETECPTAACFSFATRALSVLFESATEGTLWQSDLASQSSDAVCFFPDVVFGSVSAPSLSFSEETSRLTVEWYYSDGMAGVEPDSFEARVGSAVMPLDEVAVVQNEDTTSAINRRYRGTVLLPWAGAITVTVRATVMHSRSAWSAPSDFTVTRALSLEGFVVPRNTSFRDDRLRDVTVQWPSTPSLSHVYAAYDSFVVTVRSLDSNAVLHTSVVQQTEFTWRAPSATCVQVSVRPTAASYDGWSDASLVACTHAVLVDNVSCVSNCVRVSDTLEVSGANARIRVHVSSITPLPSDITATVVLAYAKDGVARPPEIDARCSTVSSTASVIECDVPDGAGRAPVLLGLLPAGSGTSWTHFYESDDETVRDNAQNRHLMWSVSDSVFDVAFPAPVVDSSSFCLIGRSCPGGQVTLTDSTPTVVQFSGQYLSSQPDLFVRVQYGDYACAVDSSSTSTDLKCVTSVGYGSGHVFGVIAGGVTVSTTAALSYPRTPIVQSVEVVSGPCAINGIGVDCDVSPGTKLRARGQHFLNGTQDATQLRVLLNGAEQIKTDQQTFDTSVEFELGSFAIGTDLPLQVVWSSLASAPLPFLNFNPPTFLNVTVLNVLSSDGSSSVACRLNGNVLSCPRQGNAALIFSGRNFASLENPATVQVLFEGAIESVSVQRKSGAEQEVNWQVPKGSGKDKSLVFMREGGAFAASPYTIDYDNCPVGQQDSTDGGPGDCEACPRGTYNPCSNQVSPDDESSCIGERALSGTCIACPPGYYQDEEGKFVCKPANEGFYASDSLRELPCPRGHFSSLKGSPSCTPCPGGTTSQFASNGTTECNACETHEIVREFQCVPCTLGKLADRTHRFCENCPDSAQIYAPENGTCITCPDQSVRVNFDGGAKCVKCPVGTRFQGGTCVACGAGYYGDTEGAKECKRCGPYQYSVDLADKDEYGFTRGNTRCTPCFGANIFAIIDGTIQLATGLDTCAFCEPTEYLPLRPATTVMLPNGTSVAEAFASEIPDIEERQVPTAPCLPCPEGLDCGKVRSGWLMPTDGRWFYATEEGRVESRQCLPGRCLSPATVELGGEVDASLGDNSCREKYDALIALDGDADNARASLPGRFVGCCGKNRVVFDENPLCASCIEGFYEWGGKCVDCSDSGDSFLALFFFLSWLVVLVFHRISQSTRSETKIFFYFTQMALLFFGDETDWLAWTSVAELKVTDTSAGSEVCVARFDATGQILLGIVVPLLTFVQLWFTALVLALKWGFQHGRLRGRWDGVKFNKSPFIRTTMALVIMSYNSVTDAVFTFMNCTEVRPGFSVVAAYPSLECGSGDYNRALPLIVVSGIFVTLGVPLAAAVLFWRAHKRRRVFRTKFLNRYGVLFENYRPRLFFWECVVLVRRTVLIGISTAFAEQRRKRMTALGATNLFILMLHSFARPYWRHYDNAVETVSLFVLTVVTIGLTNTTLPLSTGLNVLFALVVFLPAFTLVFFTAARILCQRLLPTHYLRLAERLDVFSAHNYQSPFELAEASFRKSHANAEDADSPFAAVCSPETETRAFEDEDEKDEEHSRTEVPSPEAGVTLTGTTQVELQTTVAPDDDFSDDDSDVLAPAFIDSNNNTANNNNTGNNGSHNTDDNTDDTGNNGSNDNDNNTQADSNAEGGVARNSFRADDSDDDSDVLAPAND